jgi:hypothetical protein
VGANLCFKLAEITRHGLDSNDLRSSCWLIRRFWRSGGLDLFMESSHTNTDARLREKSNRVWRGRNHLPSHLHLAVSHRGPSIHQTSAYLGVQAILLGNATSMSKFYPATTSLKEWQDAKRKLVAQFQAHSTPTVCVILLITWANCVHAPANSMHDASQDEVDRYVGKMFDIMWEWVTRPRSEADMQAILGMHCACSARERRTDDHARGEIMQDASKSIPG